MLRVPECDGLRAECAAAAGACGAAEWGKTGDWGDRVGGEDDDEGDGGAGFGGEVRVLKSAGNLNNAFGLPLQLLRLEPEHEVAVIEMGMNHAGEIAALAKIAEPDWGVVSNVAPVHLEFFADGIAGMARAKYELIEALPADGVAVLNGDDEYVKEFGRGMGERAVLYGTGEGADGAGGAYCGDGRGGCGVYGGGAG